jgi:hypothetical protein
VERRRSSSWPRLLAVCVPAPAAPSSSSRSSGRRRVSSAPPTTPRIPWCPWRRRSRT